MFKDGLAVSEKLRALSYIFKCPVISAVQSNTEGMNSETIGMENISESRGIAHTADFIAALYQMDEDVDSGVLKINVIKNRLGNKNYTPHQFKIDESSLDLIDMGDCDQGDNSQDSVSTVSSSITKTNKVDTKQKDEKTNSISVNNSTLSKPLSCEDAGFVNIF